MKRNGFFNVEFFIAAVPALIVVAILSGIFGIFYVLDKADKQDTAQWIKLGYNMDDVRVFLKATNENRYDFSKSPSLRKQYEAWRDGKVAVAGAPASNAGSQLVTGMVIGHMLASSSAPSRSYSSSRSSYSGSRSRR